MRIALACRCILVLALPALASAQTVWTVSASNGIQAAVNAASPGDVIVLTTGIFYTPFLLDRGLTIRGNGATVGNGPGSAIAMQVNVPAGQVAHLDQIQFTWGYSPFGSLGCPVSLAGNVRVDRCSFLSRNYATPLSISNAQVVLVGSSITSGGTAASAVALQAVNSQLTLRDCTVAGSDAGCHPIIGCSSGFVATFAAVFQSCTVQAERTTFTGGSHSTTGFSGSGASAIGDTNGLLRLADCTVTGGSSVSGAGATALLHAGTAPVELQQTQLFGGAPGGGTSTGPLDPAAPLLRSVLTPVWTRGTTSALMLRGEPGAVYALFLTPAVDAVLAPAIVVEPVWAAGAVSIAAGLLDSIGTAVYSVPVPNVAALEHMPVWCQGIGGSGLPFRASTIAGGVIR